MRVTALKITLHLPGACLSAALSTYSRITPVLNSYHRSECLPRKTGSDVYPRIVRRLTVPHPSLGMLHTQYTRVVMSSDLQRVRRPANPQLRDSKPHLPRKPTGRSCSCENRIGRAFVKSESVPSVFKRACSGDRPVRVSRSFQPSDVRFKLGKATGRCQLMCS
jgi:hypothetical protein